jgi:hypothetical protein
VNCGHFYDHGTNAAREAFKPLLEGCRMALYLEPPGWKDEQPAIYPKNFAWQVIKDNLREFDVECVSGLARALRS